MSQLFVQIAPDAACPEGPRHVKLGNTVRVGFRPKDPSGNLWVPELVEVTTISPTKEIKLVPYTQQAGAYFIDFVPLIAGGWDVYVRASGAFEFTDSVRIQVVGLGGTIGALMDRFSNIIINSDGVPMSTRI